MGLKAFGIFSEVAPLIQSKGKLCHSKKTSSGLSDSDLAK